MEILIFLIEYIKTLFLLFLVKPKINACDCHFSKSGNIVLSLMEPFVEGQSCDNEKVLKVVEKNGKKLVCCKRSRKLLTSLR